MALRADAGYFAGQLARAAHDELIAFAIGAKGIAPLWRLLAGIADDDWHDAMDMDGAQVAVAEYCPDWWPANTRLLTNLDVSTPDKAVAAEHWYRHRTSIENLFRDSKHGAALQHLPSGYAQVNTAWMWGALLAASMAAWLHQLTATTRGPTILQGHGVRGGKAMIATLRRRIISVPGRLIRHARHLTLRLPRGHGLLAEILARLRALPALP